MARTLNLSGIIAEAQSDPLVVELDRGATISIKPPSALSAETVDKLRTLIDEWESTRSDARKVTLTVRIPQLIMSERDYDTWLEHQPPLAAFSALMDAVNDFYAGAGDLGEGPASDGS